MNFKSLILLQYKNTRKVNIPTTTTCLMNDATKENKRSTLFGVTKVQQGGLDKERLAKRGKKRDEDRLLMCSRWGVIQAKNKKM